MNHFQSWPTNTKTSSQTYAGFRLRFLERFNFQFTRTISTNQIQFIQTILPSIKLINQQQNLTINNNQNQKQPYQLIQTNNRYLRNYHPQIDLPKSLLLDYILQDQQLPPPQTQSSILTGIKINDRLDLILSVTGQLTNQLICTLLENTQPTKLITNPKPIISLATPIQQLISGPSLNQDGNALFLARTHDSTTLFTYHHTISDLHHSLHPLQISYQLKTSHTQHQSHLDACIAHTINDTSHQFIILNSKAQIWKISDIGNQNSLKLISTLNHPPLDPHQYLSWARCGIYPTNDCLVVGLRDSLFIIDPRLNGQCSQLYTVQDTQQITDIQRYINNQSPHLRLINTTSSLISIDDRKPGIPILTVDHFRAHDLTLNMNFPAEPEWSPHPSYSLSTAAERFDKLLLWSRTNDLASLHQYQSYPAIPPVVVDHPFAVPISSSHPSNPRTGLVFFRRKPTESLPERLCVLESKADGSLWHQQLGLFGPSDPIPPPNPHLLQTDRRLNFPLDHSDPSENHLERVVVDSEEDDRLGSVPSSQLTLDRICQDFTMACLSKTSAATTDEPLVLGATSSLDSIDPLGFCSLPRPYELSISSNRASWPRDPIVNLTAVRDSLLPPSTNRHILFDQGNTILEEDESGLKEWTKEILTTAIDLASKTLIGRVGAEDEERGSECGSVAVDRLMAEWTLGEPTSGYEWRDVCAAPPEEEPSGPESSSYSPDSSSALRSRSLSRTSTFGPLHEIHHNRSDHHPLQPSLLSATHTNLPCFSSNPQSAHHPPKPSCPLNLSPSTFISSPSSPLLPTSFHSQPDLINHHHHHHLFSPNNHTLSSTLSSINPHPFSQIVPGTHATTHTTNRSAATTTHIHPRKKKRVGGF